MMPDYASLKVIWWLLVGVLLTGFAGTAGFDLGAGALLPFLGRRDEERRVIINSIGPTWEGNQVWLILGAGAVFAAWPMVYAAAFSGFYAAMLLALFALVLRPAGFTYRSKLPGARWRNLWDWVLCVGGVVPAVVFGIAFGNLLQGVPFQFDDSLRSYYDGSFWQLFNPFALLAGLVSLSMLLMHGAVFLQGRTAEPVSGRARHVVRYAAIALLVTFALAGAWVATGIPGYRVESIPDVNGVISPLEKHVVVAAGDWLTNFRLYPWMITAPLAGFGGALAALLLSATGRSGWAFVASCLCLAGVIFTAGMAMFPFMMPSSTYPDQSLTVWDAGSSRLTLQWMLTVTVVLLPIVLAYTAWVFRVMRGRVDADYIRREGHSVY